MRHAVFCVLALLSLSPAASYAQAGASDQFAYCQVEDTGGHEIWVSQIFPAPPNTGPMALELASEFHAHVATLGGAGNKLCLVGSRQTTEETRAKIAAIMGKRVFGVRVYKWHDVQWTPSAATYARTAPAPAVAANQYVYCRTTDADARKMVTSGIFAATLPPANNGEHFAILGRYAQAFAQNATASYGVAPGALCIASDSQAEADKSLADYRKSFPFSGIKKIEMPWVPGPALAAPAVSASVRPQLPAIAPATGAGATDDVEADFWRRISNSGQAADYEEYLAAFPQGRHAPIARLEARRLSGGRSASAVPAAGGPTAGTAAPAATAQPGDDALMRRIASDKFFRIPAGTGASAERSGRRTVGTVPLATTAKVQRAPGDNLCQLSSESTAGQDASITTSFGGTTWAGMLPLSSTLQSRSVYGTSKYAISTISIDAVEGQPFPLVKDNAFGYTFTQVTVDPAGTRTNTTMSEQCVVGDTVPASTTVAGMAGEQTELQCRLTFKDAALKPQKQVLYWYSAVGCFMQDPGR
ncbi:hypothetical protein [Lysobacter terrae]